MWQLNNCDAGKKADEEKKNPTAISTTLAVFTGMTECGQEGRTTLGKMQGGLVAVRDGVRRNSKRRE